MCKEIKTLEELREYNGRRITCTIEGTEIRRIER